VRAKQWERSSKRCGKRSTKLGSRAIVLLQVDSNEREQRWTIKTEMRAHTHTSNRQSRQSQDSLLQRSVTSELGPEESLSKKQHFPNNRTFERLKIGTEICVGWCIRNPEIRLEAT
jgi:hypothetical protein